MRAVCFAPDSHSQFKELSEKKCTQFRTSKKFGRTDLVIDRRTKVSEAASKLAFKPIKGLEQKENVDIITINELASLQTVTVRGKVCQVTGTKVQVTYQGQLKRQNGYLVDPTGCVKIVFWDKFTNVVQEGKTYRFKNVTVKRRSLQETYINTARTGSSIEECEPFKGNLAVPEDLPSMKAHTMCAKLIGLSSISKFCSCSFCSKKLDSQIGSFVECKSCKLFQDPSTCSVRWFFKGLFQNKANLEEKAQLSVFHQDVVKICSYAQ